VAHHDTKYAALPQMGVQRGKGHGDGKTYRSTLTIFLMQYAKQTYNWKLTTVKWHWRVAGWITTFILGSSPIVLPSAELFNSLVGCTPMIDTPVRSHTFINSPPHASCYHTQTNVNDRHTCSQPHLY